MFLTDECDSFPLEDVISRVKVVKKTPAPDWFQIGGAVNLPEKTEDDDVNDAEFYYEKIYRPDTARFEDLPTENEAVEEEEDDSNNKKKKLCRCCEIDEKLEREKKPRPGSELSSKGGKKEDDNDDYESGSGKVFYSSFEFKGENFRVNDCVFLPPGAYALDAKPGSKFGKQSKESRDLSDAKTYPEAYRKTGYVKGK